jgi:phosphoglycerate dehydrogenase-like enzyme
MPVDVIPAEPPVPTWPFPEGSSRLELDVSRVVFYVPRYMGPAEDLALMSRMPNLKVVQLLTAGYDNALRYLPAGVTLCNAGGVHDASTAELAVGLTLASLRGLDDFARAMPQGTWVYVRRESLADKRVLVVGAGGIGKALKARLEPFETDVILVGRSAREGVHGARDLRALLPAADVVILAVPLTDDTRGMVGTEFLAHMADGALLVNVSRGSVVDTEALTEQVASGRIRAALDVTEPEPLPPGHPLWTLPGVLISPHVGGNTTAFLPRARKLVADQLQRFAAGEPLASVVSS